jgi:hypothetical protein
MADQVPVGFVPDGFVPDAPAASAMPRDARGMPQVSSDTTDASSPLLQLLGPFAHPETLTDFARLLTLPVDTVKRAFAGALTTAAARSAASTTGQMVTSATGAAVRGVVNGTAAAGDVIDPGVIGAVSPRAGKVVELAQKIRAARGSVPVAAEAVVPDATPAAAPVVDEFTAARTARASAGESRLPDQKALNEAALAARRAAYQASQQGAPAATEVLPPAGPVVKASGKMQLTAPEFKEFTRLLKRPGMTPEDALGAVRQMRALAGKLGGATDAQVAAAVKHRDATGAW